MSQDKLPNWTAWSASDRQRQMAQRCSTAALTGHIQLVDSN